MEVTEANCARRGAASTYVYMHLCTYMYVHVYMYGCMYVLICPFELLPLSFAIAYRCTLTAPRSQIGSIDWLPA